MRHADIRTTTNVYGEAATADMMEAHGKIVGLALDGLQADCKPSQAVENGAEAIEPSTYC
jgi:hypothetical protein